MRDLERNDLIKLIALSEEPLNLRGVNLEGLDLSWLDLTGVNLNNANLENATICGTLLDRAKLDGTLLKGAEISGGASFKNAWINCDGLETLDFSNAKDVPEVKGADLLENGLQGKIDGFNQRNKNRQMDDLAIATVKTNYNLDFTKEIKKIFDGEDLIGKATEATGEITFETRETEIEDLVNEIIKVTKSYPKEEFTLEVSYEETNYSSISAYDLKNGECEFHNIDHTYIRDEDSLNPPLKAQPLLDEAIRCFEKLDVDENGKLSLSRHKHTVEVEGDEYKLLVSKFGNIYKVEKVFSKVPTYTWEDTWEKLLPGLGED